LSHDHEVPWCWIIEAKYQGSCQWQLMDRIHPTLKLAREDIQRLLADNEDGTEYRVSRWDRDNSLSSR
jgi:hypothetical protein